MAKVEFTIIDGDDVFGRGHFEYPDGAASPVTKDQLTSFVYTCSYKNSDIRLELGNVADFAYEPATGKLAAKVTQGLYQLELSAGATRPDDPFFRLLEQWDKTYVENRGGDYWRKVLRTRIEEAPAPKPPPDPPPPVDDQGIIVTPIINVSDVPASIRWFEALGWKRHYTYNAGGKIAGAADEDAAGVTYFAAIRNGYGQIFLSQSSEGLRGGAPAFPGAGDDVGATWECWWVKTPAKVDEMYQRALAAGVLVISPPEDKPWGEREMRIAHPEGHVFRVSATLG